MTGAAVNRHYRLVNVGSKPCVRATFKRDAVFLHQTKGQHMATLVVATGA